ncbi:hypothetical protein CWN36_04455 [Klebsiella pneumoniae]|nr:hypothetical protein CWN36_04455 [Klebsiella pneumoniae]
MSVPTYDNFIEPVLRVLQQSPTGVAAKEVYEGAGFVNGMVASHLLCHSGTINRHSLNGALLS